MSIDNNPKKLLNFAFLFLKPFLILSVTNLLAQLQQLTFDYWILSLELGTDLGFANTNILSFLIYLLIFNSLVLAFNSNDRFIQTKFLEHLKKVDKFSKLKFVLSTPFFYIEAILISFISVIFSTSFLHYYIPKVFFKNLQLSDSQSKIYTILIIVPLLIIVDFFSRMIIAKKWYRGINGVVEDLANSSRRRIFDTLKHIFFVLLLYCTASTILVWFLPPFMALQTATNGKFVFLLIFGLIIAVLAILGVFSARAILKRRSFINKLKNYCENNSLYLSAIENPYHSIFKEQKTFNFTVEKNGIKYDCKFLSSILPGSPIILSDNGNYIKHTRLSFFNIQLFSRMKDYRFDFESENKKILIVIPIPKNVFVSIRGSKLAPADTGEKIGEYTLYSSNGFLNSLDRNCL